MRHQQTSAFAYIIKPTNWIEMASQQYFVDEPDHTIC